MWIRVELEEDFAFGHSTGILPNDNSLEQGRCLGKTKHQVKILHGGPACAFDEVVFGADQQDAALDDSGGDIDEVRVGSVLRGRQMVDDADEWLASVEIAQAGQHFGLCN